ncbi:MAG: fructosamine kinase family protein [Gammaproteobacteria bacterium]|nr:fructosamine kinase family protein [Gammaproteobacteria bacterium]
MSIWKRIAEQISSVTGEAFNPQEPKHVGGGCINTAVKLSDGQSTFFVKLNRAELLDMFEAESEGLAALAASQSIRVPIPVCSGVAEGQAYFVMEAIPMGHGGSKSMELAGRQLAEMHRVRENRYGWQRDNTIGSTPQANTWTDDWVDFWRQHRLGFQLELAVRNGYGRSIQTLGEHLLDRFPVLIDHAPQPSLLHGDLWGGNLAYDESGGPVIYDPAVYYGDREADLAMTELFGGFGQAFYAAYREAWPIDPGYGVRKSLYNLYHILNHANMFGGGYLGQATGLMERLLAEV